MPFEIHLKLHNSQTRLDDKGAIRQFEIHLKLHNSQTHQAFDRQN